MSNKPEHITNNEYKSIRYLNLFRLLLSFFFFSIIFKKVGVYVGFSYTLDIAKLIATIYLSFSIIIWIVSVLYKKRSSLVGLIAPVADLPHIISLTLLFDGLGNGWVILPVITIGSFSILSRKPYAIFAMPVVATLLLWLLPKLLGIDNSEVAFSNILLYALTYFAIALVGIRQSQTYTQSLQLTQRQKRKIVNLSKINERIIEHMQSGVVVINRQYEVALINKKAREIIQIKNKQKLPDLLIKKIIATPESSSNNFSIYGEDVLIDLIELDKNSDTRLLFIEQQAQINEKSQQINLATLGQLSATIAHELRNPMAAIYSASQLLQESGDINTLDKELTDIIIGQIERSNKIIEDILLMSKQHIANQTKINLAQKLNKFKQDFCQQNSINTDNIYLDIVDDSLFIKFDSSHLSQLIWNLTENALKHGADGQIAIIVSNQADSVLIDFKNNGDKFEPIVEESIFTPFFTTHTQGTGLGLYICREMCKSNNAKLEYLRQDFQHVFRIHVRK
ncbi:MAG: HAMP domain-containing histidine kinase [Alcanivoracaceae bacterium]|nr:HAMP domain-containing histidine kinase [Alcanivoracaceae bacterium]